MVWGAISIKGEAIIEKMLVSNSTPTLVYFPRKLIKKKLTIETQETLLNNFIQRPKFPTTMEELLNKF